MKRALQALLISPDPVMRENCLSGKKKITIREGLRDYTVGPTMLCCEKEPWALMVDVTDVRHCQLNEVTPEEWEADGFTSKVDMLNGMRLFYQSLNWGSPVTIIRWDNARGKFVDHPELHAAHVADLRARKRFAPGDKIFDRSSSRVGTVESQGDDFYTVVRFEDESTENISSLQLEEYI